MARRTIFDDTTHVLVRTAQRRDVPQLAGVGVRSWRAAYSGIFPDSELEKLSVGRRMVQWTRMLERHSRKTLALAAEVEGRVVGFSQLGPAHHDPTSTDGELYALYVDPTAWGRGVGRALIDISLSWLAPRFDRATLWVVRENTRARRFYEHVGFDHNPNECRTFSFFRHTVICAHYTYDLTSFPARDWRAEFKW